MYGHFIIYENYLIKKKSQTLTYMYISLFLSQVEAVGMYFREQLLQSRHRGAFELAYVGFVRLTEMLCR